MRDLAGRAAVVTGAASGIGKSLAGRLAAEGMSVVLADVERRALDQAAAEIGGMASAQGDPRRHRRFGRERRSRRSPTAPSRSSAPSTCCATTRACSRAACSWECTTADFDWTLGVNLWGILHASQSFVPRMLTQGEDAHIVNTVSMAGLATTAYCAPYEVSKFAAAAATECLAHDLASQGAPIKVSLLCPGSVDTEIARSRRNRPERYCGSADRRGGVRGGGAGRHDRGGRAPRRGRRDGARSDPRGDVPRSHHRELPSPDPRSRRTRWRNGTCRPRPASTN